MSHMITCSSHCYLTQTNGNDVEHKIMNHLPMFNKGMSQTLTADSKLTI